MDEKVTVYTTCTVYTMTGSVPAGTVLVVWNQNGQLITLDYSYYFNQGEVELL